MKLGEWLKKEGISQRELARRLKVHYSLICRYVNGTQVPSAQMVLRIREATNGEVGFDDFYGRDNSCGGVMK